MGGYPQLGVAPLTAKQRVDRYKAKRKAAGECSNCPTPVAINRKTGKPGGLCSYHLWKQRQYTNAHYARKKAQEPKAPIESESA